MDKVKRILLIDDEDAVLFGLSRFLKEPGVEVDCAQTVDAATKYMGMHRYDAAIVDMRLSNSVEMEGLDCVRLLRTGQPQCKIIVLTAFGDIRLKEKTKALGADLFFEKPMEPEKLRAALQTFNIYIK